jgi:hypothetical protein
VIDGEDIKFAEVGQEQSRFFCVLLDSLTRGDED